MGSEPTAAFPVEEPAFVIHRYILLPRRRKGPLPPLRPLETPAMLRFRFLPLLSCTSLLILLAAAASAQTFRGGFNGSVTDVSGAAIPDAAVQAVNDATGV